MPWLTVPKIVWNANTLTFTYSLDGPVSWSAPRDGSERVELDSGTRDAWLTGENFYLSGRVRWVSTALWDAATGFRAFLAWARDYPNSFDWYPNKAIGTKYDSYLIEPWSQDVRPERDGTRVFTLQIQSVAGTAYAGY